MTKLGIIARADLGGGLQAQTLALCKMLKPDKILIIDSTSFNNNPQHFEMYEGFNYQICRGFPTNLQCAAFINGLTHLLTAETVYNNRFYELGKRKGIKVFNQLNWEFLEHIHNQRLPTPYKWLMPSYWHLEDMQRMFANTVYLPPPTYPEDFRDVRNINIDRAGKPRRFLHIIGKVASHDRNGTYDVIEAMKHSKENFELVIRSRFPVDEYMNGVEDKRIIFDIRDLENPAHLYSDFDAMIMPRRYGGLCLPMNEALVSALPVIMPDISPNNQALPKDWLIEAQIGGQFMARTMIDIHATNPIALGSKLDELATMSDKEIMNMKVTALDIGISNYSPSFLIDKYKEVLEL